MWHYKMWLADTSFAATSCSGKAPAVPTMLTAIGLMSGTSLDGVDVALIETDGKRVKSFGPSGYRPYSEIERSVLRQALAEAVALTDRRARPGVLAEAERIVTNAHAEAVASFTQHNHIAREDVDIVGFHGQTVLHRPLQRLTVQIGDAAALARAIHIPVMHDFRAADVAAGGQGAPFVPVYHRALAESLGRDGPMAVVNIGGVSNITYIDGADELIACDTGPGNALLDDFVFRITGQPFDCEGRLAAQGQVDVAWVANALAHPFFALPPPKSLDRNEFSSLLLRDIDPADGAATLTALTAGAIASIAATGDIRAFSSKIEIPTLVVHGADDPLIPVEAGRDTAANIRNADLLLIPGMGHEVPPALYETIAAAIVDNAHRASPAGRPLGERHHGG